MTLVGWRTDELRAELAEAFCVGTHEAALSDGGRSWLRPMFAEDGVDEVLNALVRKGLIDGKGAFTDTTDSRQMDALGPRAFRPE